MFWQHWARHLGRAAPLQYMACSHMCQTRYTIQWNPFWEATLDRSLDNVNLNINVLISPPDKRPHLLKGHFFDAKGVASQKGFHCRWKVSRSETFIISRILFDSWPISLVLKVSQGRGGVHHPFRTPYNLFFAYLSDFLMHNWVILAIVTE